MSWDNFTKSLETDGGKVVVILFMLMFLSGVSVILLVTHHPPQEVGRELLTGAFSSLLGILYGYLRAGNPAAPPGAGK